MNDKDFLLTEDEQRKILQDCLQLQQQYQTLLLSTLAEQGPELSYAPYSRDASGNYYILISALAGHCQNLQRNPCCSAMFIADESASRNLFARERLTYQCQAELVAPEDVAFAEQLQQMNDQFGEVVELLRSLPDFKLFRLRPTQGRYVVGFGKAYQLDTTTGEVSQVRPEK